MTVPADYSQPGVLMITDAFAGTVLPLLAILLVKKPFTKRLIPGIGGEASLFGYTLGIAQPLASHTGTWNFHD